MDLAPRIRCLKKGLLALFDPESLGCVSTRCVEAAGQSYRIDLTVRMVTLSHSISYLLLRSARVSSSRRLRNPIPVTTCDAVRLAQPTPAKASSAC
jgi:hypothetical protein